MRKCIRIYNTNKCRALSQTEKNQFNKNQNMIQVVRISNILYLADLKRTFVQKK